MALLPAKVESSGGLTLGARQLHEIVKGLAGDDVHLRRNEQNWAEIRGGRAEFKLVGMADREFPKLPSVAEAKLSTVDSAVLRDMFAKTAFSVSTDETRQHLAGVLFESDGKMARMVSTDGHRLSKVGRELPGGPVLDTGRAHPAQGRGRDPPRARGAGEAQRDRLSPGALPPAGRRDRPDRQAQRRPVPALRAGHPQGERQGHHRAAGRAARRLPPRLHHGLGQDHGRAAGAWRRAASASRPTTPTWATPASGSRSTTRAARCRSGSTPATSSTCSPRSPRPRSSSSWPVSSIPRWCGPATAATTSGVIMPMRL